MGTIGSAYVGFTRVYGAGEDRVNTNYIQATGGTITYDGDYRIHTFTTDDSFVITNLGTPENSTLELLVVAGGGGGGGNLSDSSDSNYHGAGGGAGGLFYTASFAITSSSSIPVVVGDGGAKGAESSYNNFLSSSLGGDSSFGPVLALGGGNVNVNYENKSGFAGGSGGGASGFTCVGVSNTCTYANGGVALQPTSSWGGFGGAGGASSNCATGVCSFPYELRAITRRGGAGGGAGGDASTTTPGPGKSYSISGTSITYAAGGASAPWNTTSPVTANRGHGGPAYQDGGSGVVIARYRYK